MFEALKGYRTKISVSLAILTGLGMISAGVQNGDWQQIGQGLAAIAAALGIAGIRWADK